MAHPIVSIVICTRNRARNLGAVLAALSRIESEHAWEVLLADNASTDETATVLREAAAADPRLRYLFVDRIGLGAARDAAWRQARGEIVAFTDDDCYVEPDYVDALVTVFREHPEVGCVGGRILLYDPEDARITIDERDAPVDIAPQRFLPAGALHGANLSFRREALETAGGFDPGLGAGTRFPCEDIDTAAAVAWAGYPLRFDPRPVVHHHHGRKTSDMPRMALMYSNGGGAYYAKQLLRPASRRAYLSGWWRYALASTPGRRRLRMREIRWAAHYLIDRKRYGFLLAISPLLLWGHTVLFLMVVRTGVARRLARWRATG